MSLSECMIRVKGTVETEKTVNFHRVKNIMIAVVAFLMLIMFLFLNAITKSDYSLDIFVGVSGFRALSLFFNDFTFVANHADIGELIVHVPIIPVILISLIVLPILYIMISSIIGAIKNKELKHIRYVTIGMVAYTLIVYIMLLCPLNISTTGFLGAEKLFYEAFSTNLSLLLLILISGLTVFMQFGVTKHNLEVISRYKVFYLMALLPLSFIFIFCLYPILLQVVMAFKDFKLATGVWNSQWVGFKHFATIFTSKDMLNIIFNTILISMIKMLINIILPLFLAIMLFDMRSGKYRKGIQTIIYIPHFFSWVVIYSISYAFLNNEGVLNSISTQLFGGEVVNYLTSSKLFIPIQGITFAWKEMGWGSIIYFAALTGIDMSLYDASKVDGAGPWKRLIHITLPSIKSVIVFMTILSLGNILKNAGGEQLLLFYNVAVHSQAMVIDTWLYFKGMVDFEYSLGSAMLFFQSFIGIVLVLGCNWFSKKYTDRSIW